MPELWETAFGEDPQPAAPTPRPTVAPAPTQAPAWQTAFDDTAPAPAEPPREPPSPPVGEPGVAPVPRPPPVMRLSDGTETPVVLTTAPKDISAETLFGAGTGVTGRGPGARQGATGIDLGSTAKAVALERAMKAIRERKAAGETFTLGEEKEIEAQEYMKARTDVARWYESETGASSGLPLLDVSPEQASVNYWLEGGKVYDSVLDSIPLEAREVVGPLIGMWQGTRLTARTPMGTKTYNEGLNWGGLDWGGRLSLFTALSNYLGAEGDLDWGGPGHMQSIARGEDLFSQWDQLEKLTERDVSLPRKGVGWLMRGLSTLPSIPLRVADPVLETLGVVDEDFITPEGAEKFGDFMVAMGLSLVDPDIWGGVGGTISKVVGKGADALTSMRNLKKAKVLDEAATNITKLVNTQAQVDPVVAAKAIDDVLQEIERTAGPGARYMLDAYTAAALGREGTASKATQKALSEMNRAWDARAGLMDQVRLNQGAARAAAAEVATWLGTKPSSATIEKAIKASNKTLDDLVKRRQAAEAMLERAQAAQQQSQRAGNAAGVRQASDAAARASRQVQAAKDATARVQKIHNENIVKRNILKEARASKGRLEIPPRLRSLVNYRDAAMRHLGAAALRADMQALHKSMRMLAKGRQTEVSSDEVQALNRQLRQALVKVAKAEDLPGNYYAAISELQQLQAKAANVGGAAIVETLGRGLDAMKKAEGLAQKRLDEVLEQGVKAGHFRRDALGVDKHYATVQALQEAARKTVGSRGLMGFSVALQRLAGVYRRAADVGAEALPAADQALLRQLGRADLAHLEANASRSWKLLHGYVEGLRRFVDPMRATAGTTDPEVQQILKGAQNVLDRGQKELATLAKGVSERGERAQKMTDYLDSAEGNTILQSTSGTTLWGEALNTLRRLASGQDGETSANVIDALARMWLTKGEHSAATLEKLANSARKFLVDRPEASFADFQRHMMVRTAQVVLGSAVREPGAMARAMAEMAADADRSTALATQVVLHAAAMDRVTSDLAKLAADLPPQAVNAMAALSSQDPRRAGEYIEDALVLLDKLGMPPKLQKQTSAWGKDLKAGFELLEDPNNAQRFFIPRRWMEGMSGRLGNLVKSGDTYAALNPNPLEQRLGRTWSTALNLWNKGFLSGLFLPRVSYFTAILAGNLGQVYSQLGAREAGAFAARSAYDLTDGAVRHIPFFGETLHAKTLGRLENGLPSAMGTFLSPTVSKFFDPHQYKASELLEPAGGGKPISFGELRKMALKYGILTSFVGQSGMQDAAARAMRNSTLDKGWRWMQEWTDSWTDMADHIEQRQRVGLFLNLVVNQGMEPRKAAAQVRDALYDWNHPMSQVEMDYFKRVFMFYTFQRKAMGQAMRHLFSTEVGLHNPMSRTIRLARAHKGAKTMSDQYMEEHYPQDPYNYPWWVKDVGQRTYMGKRPLTAAQKQYFREQQGKNVSHLVYSVPSPTTFESFNQLRTLVAATGKMAHGDWGGAAKSSLDVLGGMTGRVGEAAVDGVKQAAGLEPPKYMTKKVGDQYMRAVTKPTDRALLVPLMETMAPGSVVRKGSDIYISPSTYMAWSTLLPTFSVELASWLDPMMTRQQADNQASYLMRQLTGVMKETPYKAKTGPIRQER